MKYAIALALLGILACLGSALFFMLRQKSEPEPALQRSKSMFRALALRVAVSIVLFICILVAAKLGYLHPHGLPMSR